MVPRNGRQISRSNIKSKSFRKNHDGNDVDDEVIHYIDYIFNRAQKTPYYTKMNKYQEFFFLYYICDMVYSEGLAGSIVV